MVRHRRLGRVVVDTSVTGSNSANRLGSYA
jgi:hypothetical protein